MDMFMAIIAFCLHGECGFFVWKEELFIDQKTCESKVVKMEQHLAEETAGQASGFSACIKIPQKAA